MLAADIDYTGSASVDGFATTTSGVTVNQPSGLLEIGDDDALGAGMLTLNCGFGNSVRIAGGGTVVTTNPVTVAFKINPNPPARWLTSRAEFLAAATSAPAVWSGVLSFFPKDKKQSNPTFTP